MIWKGKYLKSIHCTINVKKKGIAMKHVKFGERKTFDKLLLNWIDY